MIAVWFPYEGEIEVSTVDYPLTYGRIIHRPYRKHVNAIWSISGNYNSQSIMETYIKKCFKLLAKSEDVAYMIEVPDA